MADCAHHHDRSHRVNTRRLLWALAVIVVFMLVELVGGVLAKSLALLADATHMLTDALALGLAVSAQFLASRPPDSRLHYGYRRTQVLAAFVNGIILAILLLWIVVEAMQRFLNPLPVNASLMLYVAAAGFAANIIAFLILHRPNERDLNMRGAMLHVVGDLLGSVAAIIAAITIAFTGWLQIDPLLSILVAVLIGVSAWRLVKETGFILLEGAPKSIDVDRLAQGLVETSNRIRGVHNVCISQMTPDQLRLTMHLCVEDASDAGDALKAAKQYLKDKHNIEISTIQIEVGDECPDSEAAQKTQTVHVANSNHSVSEKRATPGAAVIVGTD